MRVKLEPDPRRACGDCQLCCKLLPMKEGLRVIGEEVAVPIHLRGFDKPANKKCPHQKFGTGCAIYEKRPFACRTFSCRWLTNDDTADQFRPDRSRCVIDPMPDAVEASDDGKKFSIPVIQIWVDPKTPRAYREEPIRSFIERRGEEGFASLIRWSSSLGVVVFPASLAGKWFEKEGGAPLPERTIEEHIAAVATAMGEE